MARKVDTNAPAEKFRWDEGRAQAESTTHLEDDTGYGKAAVIRQFTFKANPQTFSTQPPTKQELFNAHLKQLEIMLWQDGLKIMTDVAPQLAFNKKKTQYTIIVGALPQRGQLLTQQPQLLTEIAHGK